jgi:hypothetical protein
VHELIAFIIYKLFLSFVPFLDVGTSRRLEAKPITKIATALDYY